MNAGLDSMFVLSDLIALEDLLAAAPGNDRRLWARISGHSCTLGSPSFRKWESSGAVRRPRPLWMVA